MAQYSQRLGWAIALLATPLSLMSSAAAQSATPLDRYEPSDAQSQLASVPDAEIRERMRLDLEGRLSAARSPLIVATAAGGETNVVSHQLIFHTQAQVSFLKALRVSLNLPLVLAQGGDDEGAALTAPSGLAVADLRISGQVQLLKSQGLRPGASFRFSGWLPTGDDNQFAGAGTTRLAPMMVVGSSNEHFAWGASVGHRFLVDNNGSSLIAGETLARLGAGPRLGPVLITAEVFASAQDTGDDPRLASEFPHLETMLHARADFGRWFVRAGGSLGIGEGIGTPAYRGLLGFGVTPFQASSESAAPQHKPRQTGPRILASSDDTPAAHKNCAAPSDPPSECSKALPASSARGANSGAADKGRAADENVAVDKDGDGIPDSVDACPDKAAPSHPSAELNGCPIDSDGDGIIDSDDACPKEKGQETADKTTSGCPKSVRIEGAQIVILQKIEFALSRAEIKEDSFPILEEVAGILNQHPEITLISIEGHTDSVGNLARNLKLSRQRALSVMRWLMENGVDERRLQSAGYGPKQPIAENDTAEGRAKNRRVEFRIVSDAEKNAKADESAEPEE